MKRIILKILISVITLPVFGQQFGRPTSDITATSVTGTPTNTAGSRYTNVDESTLSTTDFIYGTNNTAAVYEGKLNTLSAPASGACVFRYSLAKTNAGVVDGGGSTVTVTMDLVQGTTIIASSSAITVTGTWTSGSVTLTQGQVDAITDWTDLRIRMTTSTSGGTVANRRGGAVSWVELEIPSAPTVTRKVKLIL